MLLLRLSSEDQWALEGRTAISHSHQVLFQDVGECFPSERRHAPILRKQPYLFGAGLDLFSLSRRWMLPRIGQSRPVFFSSVDVSLLGKNKLLLDPLLDLLLLNDCTFP